MTYPWVNILLFGLLILQLITGYFGFTSGRISQRWILWLHGIGAYTLMLLFFWKASVIVGAIRRRNRWTGRRLGFAITTLLLALVLAAGLLWSFAGPLHLAGFSLVSIHIYLAIPLILLLAWHTWHMRFIFRPSSASPGRRIFLRSAAGSLGGLLLWRSASLAKAVAGLSGAGRRFTGSYPWHGSGSAFPSVSWIADRPSPVNLDTWRLAIEGEVARPLSLSYAQLMPHAIDTAVVTLDCTGGWYTTQTWHGIRLARLLELAGINGRGHSVIFEAVSGYRRRFSLWEAQEYLLAMKVAGEPLSHGHGFPLRLVAPNQRGLNWVKWLTRIEVSDASELWQLPLPLQ